MAYLNDILLIVFDISVIGIKVSTKCDEYQRYFLFFTGHLLDFGFTFFSRQNILQ